MKFYQSTFIVTLLLYSFQADAWWPKWFDTVAAKFNPITDLIHHKEFTQADGLEIHNQAGTIVINSWKQKSIAIEVIISCPENFHKDIKVDMECIDKIIKIHTNIIDQKLKAHIVFNILVPQNTDITACTKQGDIIIKDVSQDLYLETLQGDIKLINPHHAVIATTGCGNISVSTDSIDHAKNFSLISNKGNIDIYIPEIINSYIQASALQGKVVSEVPITLQSQTTLLNPQSWKNFKQIVVGSLGTPSSTITMIADNGSITILPYMKQNNIF